MLTGAALACTLVALTTAGQARSQQVSQPPSQSQSQSPSQSPSQSQSQLPAQPPTESPAASSGSSSAQVSGQEPGANGTPPRAGPQLPPVVVRAGRVPSSGSGFVANEATLGPLGSRSLLDTPYSINVINAEVIENQRASSLTDVMKYLPSTQMEARGGMDVGRPQSRGMRGDVVANNHLDGLNVVGTTAWPMEMMERVEVVNGLTGALYGPANPAGNFNFVQKRPTRDDLREVTLGYRSRKALTLHADLGGRAGPDGIVGYRANLLTEDGESFVRDSDLDRKLAAFALDFQLSRDTVLEVNASHYSFDKYGLPGGFQYEVSYRLPDAPDASRRGYGQPFAGMKLETNTGSARIHHAFSSNWKLTAGFGRQIADRYFSTPTNRLTGNDGSYVTEVGSSAAGRFTVNSNLASLTGKVHWGDIRHELVFSTIGYEWKTYSALDSENYTLGNASFDHPRVNPAQSFLDSGPRYQGSRTRIQSFTVGDTMHFSPRWSLMLLGSHADLKSDSFNRAGTRTAQYDKSGFSGTAALMYKPRPDLSTYLAYADTLQQGSVAGTRAANPGEVLPPFRSKQYELGAKYAFGAMNAGVALFQIERPFAFTGPDNYFREQGEQRNRGLELSLNGDLGRRWSLYGGVTFLDAKLGETADPTTSGRRMVGVPRWQAALLADYRWLEVPGLAFSGSIRHTGKREINTQNTATVDGFNIIDLGARYTHRLWGRQTTWRFAINNVTDERYWVAIFPGNIDGGVAAGSAFLGDSREVLLSMTMAF